MREPLPPPPMIADVMADDGASWLRLVTAIVRLGLSLAIGQRTDREPPPPKSVPQPERESVVAEAVLVPLAASEAATTQPSASLLETKPSASPADPAVAAPAPATGHAEPLGRSNPPQVDSKEQRPAGKQAVRPRRHPVPLAAREPAAARRSVRTRAQVRSEYLRSRELVAALTGEDSGSAYLARAAARQRATGTDRRSPKAMAVAAARRPSR